MIIRRVAPAVLIVSCLAAASAQDLHLDLSIQGDRLTATVTLEAASGPIVGLSFAVCHSTADVLLESVREGSGIPTARNGKRPDFLGIRSDDAGGFVTLGMVTDLGGSIGMPSGTHEVLVLTYSLRPGGTGTSLAFCEAGDPPIRALVVTGDGSGVHPRTYVSGNRVSAGDAAAAIGDGVVIPISLTTGGAGFTGGTFVLCHDGTSLRFGGVDLAPELAWYSPALSPPVETASGFTVTLALGSPLPEVDAFPVLLARYTVIGWHDISTPIAFCGDGDAATVLRFGAKEYRPLATGGSVQRIPPSDDPVDSFLVSPADAGIEDDPVPVSVGSILTGRGGPIAEIRLSITFDAAAFAAVVEGSADAYRGADLAAFLAGRTPERETMEIGAGSFNYSVAFPADHPLAWPDVPSFPEFSLLRLRLARNEVALPGGGTGKKAGLQSPVKLGGTSGYFVERDAVVRHPALRDGLVTIAPRGVLLEVSSSSAEIYQPVDLSVSLDSPAGDVQALSYTVAQDPSKLAISDVRAAPALLALSPRSSTFTRGNGFFRHDVVFDPARPLGPGQGFALSNVEYRSTGVPGDSFPVGVVSGASSLALSVGGHVYAVGPLGVPGQVRLTEDPSVIAYRAVGGRAAPGSKFVASIAIDAAVAGIPAFQGCLAHDPAMADLDAAYIHESVGGMDSIHLGAALKTIDGGFPPQYHIVNHASGPEGEHGVLFAADLGEGALPPGLGLEVFRIGYKMTGRYGDEMPLRFVVMSYGQQFDPENPLIENNVVSRDFQSVPVANLIPGKVILTDELARTIAPAATPGSMRAAAVTEFGWRWGAAAGASELQRFDGSGKVLGAALAVGGAVRRIASGGEGWAWVSLPARVSVVRYDRVEREVAVGGEPYGIAVDGDRNVWAAVAGSRGALVHIARDGRVLRTVDLGESWAEPREVLIDEEGAIWVAAEGSPALCRVSADGAVIRAEAARLRSSRPRGLAADGRGTVWASDAGDRSLLAFDRQGREVRRIALAAEPTDISLDGKGDIWTVLVGLDGRDQLVRIHPGDPPQVTPAGDSSTYFGDRTGLLALRVLLPEEDGDRDGIGNLIEIRSGTDPLDAGDPPAGRMVPPVRDLAAAVTSLRIARGGGGGGAGGEAAMNEAGVTWKNTGTYTKHVVTVEGGESAELGGDAISARIRDLPPGPSTVVVRSYRGDDGSSPVSATVLFGPGTSVETGSLDPIQPQDVAVHPGRGSVFVLDGRTNRVAVGDPVFREWSSFAVPAPLGGATAVLTGIAVDAAAGDGEGRLYVLDGSRGLYGEMTLEGSWTGGPWAIPETPGGQTFYSRLKAGRYGGRPSLFAVARRPINDDIIVFFTKSDEEAHVLSHPLAGDGVRYSLGGIAFRPGETPDEDRLWIATALEGEAVARLVLEVPLDGSRSRGRVLLSVFDGPAGVPAVRGIDVWPDTGNLVVATGDRRIHLLSDFGVVRGAAGEPSIAAVAAPGGGEAFGAVAGGTEVVIEGENFGEEPEDLRVLFGTATAANRKLEAVAGGSRLTVVSPPADGPGPVPVYLFRTGAFDFRQKAFLYCDASPGQAPDCNGDGLPDACDIAAGRSSDVNGNGIPDECERTPFIRGDADESGEADITDAICILGYQFLGIPAVLGCVKSADVDGNGAVEITDPVYLLTYLFLGGTPPPAPFPACASDEPGALSCESSSACRSGG